MKKIILTLLTFCALLTVAGCMHECTCYTTQDITRPDHNTLVHDTTVVPSKLDCSIMDVDTIYGRYDTIMQPVVVDSLVVDSMMVENVVWQVHNIVVCR